MNTFTQVRVVFLLLLLLQGTDPVVGSRLIIQPIFRSMQYLLTF
jgi:hypothetical protein